MQKAQQSIFRNEALKRYTQNRQRDVLPVYISVRGALLLWILLGIFVLAGAIAWNTKVPVYISGAGIVLNAAPGAGAHAGRGTTAAIFLPPAASAKLHVGLPVQVQLGGGARIASQVSLIEPGLLSPYAALKRFGMNGYSPYLASGPSIVALIKLGTTIQTEQLAGSILLVNVRVGTQSVLALLPGIGNLMGE